MIPVAPISSAAQIASAYGNSAAAKPAAAADFGAMVTEVAQSALQTVQKSEHIAAAGVSGTADVQQVVQALSDAELTMQTVVAVRDKVLGAYNDIMKMTI
jgi:flagellar hook-basal body complex protein FliE